MENFIKGKCIQYTNVIFAIGPYNLCHNIVRHPFVQISRNFYKLSRSHKFKGNPYLTLIKSKGSSSSVISRISCSCVLKHNKGNTKVTLIGNIKSPEKNLSSYEAPLVHHACSGFVVDLQKSFLNNKFKGAEISTNGPHDVILNELELLTETKLSHRTLFGGNKVEDDKPKSASKWIIKSKNTSVNQSFYGNLPKYYASLAKSRLTGLVVLTSMAGYAIAPAPFDLTIFVACALGTALTSSSANSINQFFEVSYDSQMSRTKNRVLVRGLLSPLHAITFSAVCGGMGIAVLYFGVNELTAVLGALNLIIYTSIYTPLKQMSIINTWVGSVVGAIPPMMGWAGCTGSLGPGALIIGGMLYAWQFPHFNALSWNIKHDYAKAGYKMMAISHPELCRKTALRYSASLIVLSTLAPVYDVTTWTFALESLPINLYLTYLAWNFYKEADSKSSRKLFRFSLLHLPALLFLMFMSKKELNDKEPLSKGGLEEENNPSLIPEPS